MIIAVIGMSILAPPVQIVEVQDLMEIVATDMTDRLIELQCQLVADYQEIILTFQEDCRVPQIGMNKKGTAITIAKRVLNWSCPIRGTPVLN